MSWWTSCCTVAKTQRMLKENTEAFCKCKFITILWNIKNRMHLSTKTRTFNGRHKRSLIKTILKIIIRYLWYIWSHICDKQDNKNINAMLPINVRVQIKAFTSFAVNNLWYKIWKGYFFNRNRRQDKKNTFNFKIRVNYLKINEISCTTLWP